MPATAPLASGNDAAAYSDDVGPIALRRLIRRLRHHAAGLVVLAALAGAVGLHHSAIDMDAAHHAADMSAVEMCLGVVTAASAAVIVVALGWLAVRRPAAVLTAVLLSTVGVRPAPRARAGPSATLAFFCVWRT